MEDSKEFLQIPRMQKTEPIASIIDIERGSSGGNVTDDEEVDQQFSYSNSHEKSTDRINSSSVGNPSPEVHHDSIFSIEILKQFDDKQHSDADKQTVDHIYDSGCLFSDNKMPLQRHIALVISLRVGTTKSTEGIEHHKMRPQSRSFENIRSLDGGTVDFHDVDDIHSPVRVNSYNFPEEYGGSKDSLCQLDLAKSDHIEGLITGQKVIERFDSNNETNIYRFHSIEKNTSGNEGEELEIDDGGTNNLQPVSSAQKLDELNPKEYNIRRIEEWISQIDMENGCIVEKLGESSCSFSTDPSVNQVLV